MPPVRPLDTIYLRNLQLSAVIGPDAWDRPNKAQPIVLSLQLQVDTTSASLSDDIKHTFSYGQMCKDVTTKLDGKVFLNINHLVADVADLADTWPGEVLRVQALAPKGLLRVEGGYGREVTMRRVEIVDKVSRFRHLQWHVGALEWVIKGLRLACIIGVNSHERLEKQNVCIDLRIPGEMDPSDTQFCKGGSSDNWRTLVKRMCEIVEASSFQTLEALAGLIAKTCLDEFPVTSITVSVEKPSALIFVAGAGVEITRGRQAVVNTMPPPPLPLETLTTRGRVSDRKVPGIHTEEWMGTN